uniref:Uncharacterized protein n=1 Tax=Noctiluca scintillans TaxID=2966 RepID=A0A7S1ATF6_NOCSC
MTGEVMACREASVDGGAIVGKLLCTELSLESPHGDQGSLSPPFFATASPIRLTAQPRPTGTRCSAVPPRSRHGSNAVASRAEPKASDDQKPLVSHTVQKVDPELYKACASAGRAKAEFSALWRAVEASVDASTLASLKRQEAIIRAKAEAEMEQSLRSSMWDKLRDATDSNTYAAVALTVRGGSVTTPAMPVRAALALFESDTAPRGAGSLPPKQDGEVPPRRPFSRAGSPDGFVLSKAAAFDRTVSAASISRANSAVRVDVGEANTCCSDAPGRAESFSGTIKRSSMPPRPPSHATEDVPVPVRRRSDVTHCAKLFIRSPEAKVRKEENAAQRYESPSVRDRVRAFESTRS